MEAKRLGNNYFEEIRADMNKERPQREIYDRFLPFKTFENNICMNLNIYKFEPGWNLNEKTQDCIKSTENSAKWLSRFNKDDLNIRYASTTGIVSNAASIETEATLSVLGQLAVAVYQISVKCKGFELIPEKIEF